jgi:hypothetical protein
MEAELNLPAPLIQTLGAMRELSTKSIERLNAYRHYANQANFSACRLVQYAGSNRPNGKDVDVRDVEKELVGCLAEGFYVDWLCIKDKLYVCVQEPDGPVPPWEFVIAENELVAVDEILKQAGFLSGA